jgi:hypothetical protein
MAKTIIQARQLGVLIRIAIAHLIVELVNTQVQTLIGSVTESSLLSAHLLISLGELKNYNNNIIIAGESKCLIGVKTK